VDAAALLDLGRRLGWRVRLGQVAIVCGLAASGKSTVAAALAARAGATLLSSDIVRKELLGVAATDRAPASAYGPATNRRTYAALGERAQERIDGGGHVVVDATFRFGADRRAFAEALGAVPLWIKCRAPAAVRARRAAVRRERPDTVSDAGAAVAVAQQYDWQPLDAPRERQLEIDTDRDSAAVLAAVRDALDSRLRRPAGNYAHTRRA
jgi:predicted kinase